MVGKDGGKERERMRKEKKKTERERERGKEIHSIEVNFNLQQIPAATQCESCNVAQSL